MAVNADAQQQPVLVIMGVSGSGKSTVAAILAGHLGWDLQEGDDLHPGTNVDKMAAGIALTDDDRWPWLDRVADWIRDHTMAGVPGIITCSALKRVYRDRVARRARGIRPYRWVEGEHRQTARRPHRPFHADIAARLAVRRPGTT